MLHELVASLMAVRTPRRDAAGLERAALLFRPLNRQRPRRAGRIEARIESSARQQLAVLVERGFDAGGRAVVAELAVHASGPYQELEQLLTWLRLPRRPALVVEQQILLAHGGRPYTKRVTGRDRGLLSVPRQLRFSGEPAIRVVEVAKHLDRQPRASERRIRAGGAVYRRVGDEDRDRTARRLAQATGCRLFHHLP